MSKKRSNEILVQGTILAVASILVRIIGLIYRIPLNRILGDTGIGLYSTAYSMYSVLLMISSLSLPLAVSKLISARMQKKEYKNVRNIFRGAIFFAVVAGGIVALVLFFGADALSRAMGFPASAMAMKTLAPTLFIVSVVGVLRGFFQGVGSMLPTAASQVLEQIANATISIFAAYSLKNAATVANEAAYGAAGGTIGTGVGALAALLFMIFIYNIYKRPFRRLIKKDQTNEVDDYKQVTKLLLVTVIPVLISTTVYNISNFMDNAIFGKMMETVYDWSEEKRAAYWGVYNNKYYLLITLPISIASAYAPSIVISLTRSMADRNKGQIINKIESSIKFIMLIAIPAGIGLVMLGGPIVELLFPESSTHQISVRLMRLCAFSVIGSSLFTTTNAILQGIDKIKVPMKHAIISILIHIPILFFFIYVMKWNIFAVAISDILFTIIACSMNLYAIKKYTGYVQEVYKTFILPFISALIMGFASHYIHHFIRDCFGSNRPVLGNMIAIIIAIIIAILIYGLCLMITKSITKEELYQLPKGEKIAKIAQKLHLVK